MLKDERGVLDEVVLKALLQRVTRASVSMGGEVVGRIGPGLVVFAGVSQDDAERDVIYLADKIAGLRIFADDAGKFNLSVTEAGGEIMIVSQFTLLADTRKGRRPSFVRAARPGKAEVLFNFFVDRVRDSGLKVVTGCFQQHMLVKIWNDGPVTIEIDSKEKYS